MKPRDWPEGLIWREEMLGQPGKTLQPCEKDNVYWMRRAITAARNLPEGHHIGASDLMWTRPMNGLAPGEEAKLVDGVLAKALKRGEPILTEHLKGKS